MASSNNVTKNNSANNYAAVSRYATAAASSGWGPLPTSLSSSIATSNSLASTTTGVTKTLADYLKESAAYSNSLTQQQRPQHQQQTASGTASLPWAAAIKAAEQQQQQLQNAASNHSGSAVGNNAFDTRSNAIGSWNSPETSTSTRSGWNSDGSMKSDGTPDDGTAIWGNPSTKKTGIDWTEKESLLNPPQVNNNSSDKRAQKSEPAISSLNGTEAWGTPTLSTASNSLTLSATNSQQQSKLNDNSGNNYGTKNTTINNEPLGWGESSSLQGNNESSSPPNNSIWNNLANNGKHKPATDWLSSSSSTASSSLVAAVTNSRIGDLNKQLEATSLFDVISSSTSLAKNSSSLSTSAGNNPNFDNQPSAINSSTNNVIGAGTIGLSGSNSINDLKQMSANFSNDLLDSSSRPPGGTLASSNNPQSQMNTYPLGVAPSRELLKQMVHQIQLAVHAGHINAQILNQPMSTPTLQLVYTLLQQIRLLQQFQDIQQRTVSKTNDVNSPNNLDLQINRVQQNISLLQKAITQQQAALSKNESLVDANPKQQQAANNYSYANVSKLSTNMKVPPSNISNLSSNNSIDSFKRSGLIDTLPSNSNSDSQRSAQATIDANASIDKTLSPLLQSSVNNILNNRAQSFASGHSASQQQQQLQQQQQQQAQKSGLLSAQTSLSSSNAAWMAFNSSDHVPSGWPRISSNVSQQDQQFNSDLVSEFVNARGWRGSSLMSSDGKEIRPPSSLAPGAHANLARPNSASNNLKQMSETNDILSKDQSSFYDWSNNSDSLKRHFDSDTTSVSSFSPSAIGGLSLQSNPWLYPPTSSSLNFASGIDNLSGKGTGNGPSHGGKLDNGNADKMGGDSLNFLRSNSGANDMQRSSSALYDWGNIGSSTLQFNADPSPIGSKQSSALSNCGSVASSANSQGARPAPPPGILCGFGSMMGNSSNSMNETPNRKSIGETQMPPSRESAANLWSGTWFD